MIQSIWGKLGGAGIGLALGGPIGALLGGVAGHVVVDREVRAFEQIVEVPESEHERVTRLFELAQQTSDGFEAYARQISDEFRDERALLEEVLDGLFHIAKADEAVHEAE